MDRRRALKTLFCFSAVASYRPLRAKAFAAPASDAQHLLAIGDFGTTGADQKKVAEAMANFMKKESVKPTDLLLLGDNFYSKAKDGFSVDSERWKTTFEEVYPASQFPFPCRALLGNHDYHDNPGGELIQLQYAKEKKTRWSMPSKWYRFELGLDAKNPWLTVIVLDSNLPAVSGGIKDKKVTKSCLKPAEVKAQNAWLKEQFESARAPMTLVLAHHPLYSNGSHGDTEALIKAWGKLFQEHDVHAYMCGHDHDMQHLELEDKFTSFVLSGGGGAKVRNLKSERSIPYGKPINGFTHLEVFSGKLRFSHYDANGECMHQFEKHQNGSISVG